MNDDDYINSIFVKGYPYIGYISALLVITLLIVSLLDIISFITHEISQNISLSLNPKLLNKDTNEAYLLRFAKKTTDASTYNIYVAQQVTSVMYLLFGVIIIYIIIHVGFIFLLPLYKHINKKETTNTAPAPTTSNASLISSIQDIDSKPFFSILVMIVLAIIYSATFRNYFIKDVQPDIIELSKSITDITGLIYDNLTTNEKFLTNLVNENMDECYRIINSQGNRSENIGSMIFTMSLFDYYKKFSDKRIFEKVKAIFTIKEIRNRSVEPFSYLYYNQKTFIPNMYQSTEIIFKKHINKNIVRQDVKNRINAVNRKLVNMFLITSISSNVRMYMIVCCLIAGVFAILIGILYADEFLIQFNKIKDLLSKSKKK
jgi:hypothetical protein